MKACGVFSRVLSWRQSLAVKDEASGATRADPGVGRVRKGPWTEEEDANLIAAINLVGSTKRQAIANANMVTTRSKEKIGARVYFLRQAGRLKQVRGHFRILPVAESRPPVAKARSPSPAAPSDSEIVILLSPFVTPGSPASPIEETPQCASALTSISRTASSSEASSPMTLTASSSEASSPGSPRTSALFSRRRPRPWTREEDRLLVRALNETRAYSAAAVVSTGYLPTRTRSQIANRLEYLRGKLNVAGDGQNIVYEMLPRVALAGDTSPQLVDLTVESSPPEPTARTSTLAPYFLANGSVAHAAQTFRKGRWTRHEDALLERAMNTAQSKVGRTLFKTGILNRDENSIKHRLANLRTRIVQKRCVVGGRAQWRFTIVANSKVEELE
eukprot:GHVT01032916.1.p1 GENE.GHVT01032916.1~~GHVT01032916.1.p1  ORF type:complete len:389 (+),score=70.60 GHVT01032916.1:1447-2613(+)